MRWETLMFQSTGTTIDAETAMTNYVPDFNGTLVGIRVVVGQVAATSLAEAGYIKMTHSGWGGREAHAGFNGVGLRTAPAVYIPHQITPCNLPVKAGVPIKGWYYWNVTPVTPELFVYGIFEG